MEIIVILFIVISLIKSVRDKAKRGPGPLPEVKVPPVKGEGERPEIQVGGIKIPFPDTLPAPGPTREERPGKRERGRKAGPSRGETSPGREASPGARAGEDSEKREALRQASRALDLGVARRKVEEGVPRVPARRKVEEVPTRVPVRRKVEEGAPPVPAPGLDLDPGSLVQGIVYGEVLGPPRARKPLDFKQVNRIKS